MEIKELNKETYAGKKFTVRYQTNGYYDIQASEGGFQMKYVSFASPVEKSFDDDDDIYIYIYICYRLEYL